MNSKKPKNPRQRTYTQYSQIGQSALMPTVATTPVIPVGQYSIMPTEQGPAAFPLPDAVGLLFELPDMRSQHVVSLVESFWNSEADYKDGNAFVHGGAAFKTGIMLYGPPGSGKSCTLRIVANKIMARGGTVFYGDTINPMMLHVFLNQFSQVEPNRKCIVILEDFDALVGSYGAHSYLEMLDSAKSVNNVLFIATTNYPERLDPRTYNRPGRFSHIVEIGMPTAKAREAYLKAILKNHRDVKYLVANSEGFTIDHLTALVNAVYREKKDLKTEMERLRTLFGMAKQLAGDGNARSLRASLGRPTVAVATPESLGSSLLPWATDDTEES